MDNKAALGALDKMPHIWITIQSDGTPKVGTIEYGENEKYYSEEVVIDLLYQLSLTNAPEVMTESQFNEWISDRFNEYSRSGLLDDNAPNYNPAEAIEELITDHQERFPNGVKIAGGDNG